MIGAEIRQVHPGDRRDGGKSAVVEIPPRWNRQVRCTGGVGYDCAGTLEDEICVQRFDLVCVCADAVPACGGGVEWVEGFDGADA